MDSNETKAIYNKLGVPQQLNINNETYTFKKELIMVLFLIVVSKGNVKQILK